MTPLTVPEARAILAADEALDATYEARLNAGQTLGSAEADAWISLVKSAHDRIASYAGTRGTPPQESVGPKLHVESRPGYTTKRLTVEDGAHIAELLRVSIDDKHWLAWRPKLREIHKKMIERMGDIYPVTLSVLACREGSSWVVQSIEQDVASQGESLLGALVDLGRMFDARDQLIADSDEPIVANPHTPAEYERAIAEGHYIGVLPLGVVRVAQVYLGISPFERRTR